MAILNFTLSPEALSKLHDALVCLGKFSESVSIEAVYDKVCHAMPLLYKLFLLMATPARPDSSQFLQIRICFIYLGRKQVLLQVPVQGN